MIIAEDRQQHGYRQHIILGGPGSGSEVTPLGRAGAGSRHKKAGTVQQRVVDAHWSLRMALAWITYRSEQDVVDIKHGRRAPTKAAIRDLLSAQRSGKLIAHGVFEGERIPHPIETAIWSTFEVVAKSMIFAGHIFLPTSGTPVVIARRMGPPQTQLLSAIVPAANVRKLWPAAKQTAAGEARCRQYLVTQMKQSLYRAPKPKSDFLADCQARIPGLSERGFERAWADAMRLTGAVGWSKAGRRRKSSRISALNRCRITTKNHCTKIIAPACWCPLFPQSRLRLLSSRGTRGKTCLPSLARIARLRRSKKKLRRYQALMNRKDIAAVARLRGAPIQPAA